MSGLKSAKMDMKFLNPSKKDSKEKAAKELNKQQAKELKLCNKQLNKQLKNLPNSLLILFIKQRQG